MFHVRKMGSLNIPFNIYHGSIIILPEKKQYNVHLAMEILKITHEDSKDKIKYFIELNKTKITSHCIDNIIRLTITRKKLT